ncbi:circadian-associated transcriptional repressor-like isoform X2 [Anguilla rostrata]
MQSSGSTSSQASRDSLSSSDSFLFGEDDGGVFLAARRPGGAACSAVRGSAGSPASQWACDGFSDRERCSPPGSGPAERRSGDAPSSYSALVSSSSSSSGGAQTEGDHLFARKCVELQGFIRPLLELLSGLKKGRFDRGLSSFQQSVAMDRIQRIVGVLRKPTIGGKYLHTLLQVEMMLKLWFPQITPCAPSASERSAPPHGTPPHKHRDQLHIPVKKRRLSWSDTDSPAPPPLRCKRFDRGGQEGGRAGGPEGCGPAPPAASGAEGERGAGGHARRAAERPGDAGEKREREREREREHGVISWSELSTTWVHVTAILSPPTSCSSHDSRGGGAKGGLPARALSPPSASGSPATQDSSVSSTTPSSDPHRLLPPQCQPVACRSQPVATETEDCEGGAPEARQGRSQSLPPLLKPLNGGGRVRMHSPTQT